MTTTNKDALAAHDLADPIQSDVPNSGWHWLYIIGGIAGLLAVVVFRRNLGAEISLLSGQSPPITANDWFTLLQNNSLLGLALLNLFDMVNYALVGLMILALYAVLERINKRWMLVGGCMGLTGTAVYFASNQAFAMLSLSHQYAAAATEAQRAVLVSAGEALLAVNNPGTVYQGAGIYMSLFLVTLAGLIISIVILQSDIFSRATAYMGILANLLVLAYFVTLVFAPTLIFVPHTAAAVPLIIWELLIARRLLQLAQRRKANV